MVGAEDGNDYANIVSNSLDKVRRWKMVRISTMIECGTKFDICLRVHALAGAVLSDASQVREYVEPISKVIQARNKQALRVCMGLLDAKENLKEFVS